MAPVGGCGHVLYKRGARWTRCQRSVLSRALLHVDYLKPTPIAGPLEIRGRIKEIKGRKVVVEATVYAAAGGYRPGRDCGDPDAGEFWRLSRMRWGPARVVGPGFSDFCHRDLGCERSNRAFELFTPKDDDMNAKLSGFQRAWRVAAGLAVLISVNAMADDASMLEDARKVASAVPPKLLQVLGDEIAKNGPATAMNVQGKSPANGQGRIGAEWLAIRRVSLRNRNPKAVPDAWERSALRNSTAGRGSMKPPPRWRNTPCWRSLVARSSLHEGLAETAGVPGLPWCQREPGA